jgi:DNA-binding GntR family transcriptional regulator
VTATDDKTRTRDGDAGARIADGIRTGIISGQYPPGTRIRQEDLASEYGASRVPVREAIRQLEFEGLVTVVANAGAWVSRLTLAECEEVYQMRERLEPLLLRYSAPGLTDADLDHLAGLAESISAAGDDTEAFLTFDREFHLFSYSKAETTQLLPLVHKLWNTTAPTGSNARAASRTMSIT